MKVSLRVKQFSKCAEVKLMKEIQEMKNILIHCNVTHAALNAVHREPQLQLINIAACSGWKKPLASTGLCHLHLEAQYEAHCSLWVCFCSQEFTGKNLGTGSHITLQDRGSYIRSVDQAVATICEARPRAELENLTGPHP